MNRTALRSGLLITLKLITSLSCSKSSPSICVMNGFRFSPILLSSLAGWGWKHTTSCNKKETKKLFFCVSRELHKLWLFMRRANGVERKQKKLPIDAFHSLHLHATSFNAPWSFGLPSVFVTSLYLEERKRRNELKLICWTKLCNFSVGKEMKIFFRVIG